MLQQSVEELQAIGKMVGIGPERCADIKAAEVSIVSIPTMIDVMNGLGMYDEKCEHMIRAGFAGGYTTVTVRYFVKNVDAQSSEDFPPASGYLVMPQDDLSTIFFHKIDKQGVDRTTIFGTMHAGDKLKVDTEYSADSVRTWTLTDDPEWFDANTSQMSVTPASTLNPGMADEVYIRTTRYIQNIDFFPAPTDEGEQ